MLKIRFSNNSLPPFWVLGTQFTIGSSKTNQLCLESAETTRTCSRDSSVSHLNSEIAQTHAKITRRGDCYFIRDMGSQSGTFVNGQRITQRSILCGDLIRIGTTELEIIDPFSEDQDIDSWRLIADSSWLSGQEFPLNFDTPERTFVMGRGHQCDIVIPGKHLSREHAALRLEDGQLFIQDLNAPNGTFVNEKTITDSPLKPDDRIRLDVYTFKVFGPGIELPRAATSAIKSDCDKIKRDCREDTPDRRWVTKPTSMGNRSENNLYQKNWLPIGAAIVLLFLFVSVLSYLIL